MTDQAVWCKIVDYYYDNVHWETPNIKVRSTITQWLRNEYHTSYVNGQFKFDDDKSAAWFSLRWE